MHEHEQLCFICYRVADMPTPQVLSRQWPCPWLRRADLGTEEISCRTAQNLYLLHRYPATAKICISLPAFKQSAQPG